VTGTLVADEQLHAAAVIAIINAGLPAQTRAYDLDDVPATLPTHYVAVTVSRRVRGELRAAATSTAGWRDTTRVVDKNSVTNARNTAKIVRSALEFASLSVDGKASTAVQFESAEPIGPDDGWWSGLTTWTYTL
jgi:hypothetical protein